MALDPTHPDQHPQGTVPAELAEGLVPVMFAGTRREAEACASVLRRNEIDVLIGEEEKQRVGDGLGIPILVPGSSLDVASEILSSHDLGATESPKMAREEDDEEEEFEDDADFGDDEEEFEEEDDWDDEEEFDDDEEFEEEE